MSSQNEAVLRGDGFRAAMLKSVMMLSTFLNDGADATALKLVRLAQYPDKLLRDRFE
jgi:hypothetical protein